MPSHTVIQAAIVRADLAILAAGRCALLVAMAAVILIALQSMRHSGNPRRSQRAERAAQGTAAERTTAPSTTHGGRPRRGATAGGKRTRAAAAPSRTTRPARRATDPHPCAAATNPTRRPEHALTQGRRTGAPAGRIGAAPATAAKAAKPTGTAPRSAAGQPDAAPTRARATRRGQATPHQGPAAVGGARARGPGRNEAGAAPLSPEAPPSAAPVNKGTGGLHRIGVGASPVLGERATQPTGKTDFPQRSEGPQRSVTTGARDDQRGCSSELSRERDHRRRTDDWRAGGADGRGGSDNDGRPPAGGRRTKRGFSCGSKLRRARRKARRRKFEPGMHQPPARNVPPRRLPLRCVLPGGGSSPGVSPERGEAPPWDDANRGTSPRLVSSRR